MRLLLPAVLVATAFCTVSCGSHASEQGVSLNSSFRDFISPNYDVLAGLDLAKLHSTELYRKHAAEFHELYDSLGQFGLDLRNGVNQVVVSSDGENTLLLASGRFDENKLKQPVKGTQVESERYHSYQLFGAEHYRVTVLRSSILLAGNPEVVHAALDAKDSGRGEVPETLTNRMANIPKGSQLWIASRDGLPFAKSPMRSDVRSMLSNIVSFISGTTAGVEVGSGLHLDAKLNCISSDGVTRVHDALRGAIGIARLSTRDDQSELLKVYDAIQVEKAGDSVKIKADLNADQVERLLGMLPQLRSRAGQLAR